ncbi:sugar transferase [Dethiobacter alkaliphilus]|uniref:sugar transferase n=1 Tax=Dethiobacter alkaliphilus TaxID=427926 RepID=UPI002227E2A2|nr:sugar transferase [Dethiobacter alkaliphilus]MCW3488822.1 sugar transferase [Dethiobacter alkaliphilus]
MGINSPKTWVNYVQALGDLLILNLVLALAFTIQQDWNYFLASTELYLGALVFLTILSFILFNFYGLYNTINKDWTDILTAVVVSVMFLGLAIIVISYAIPNYIFPRRVLFTFVMIYVPVIVLWRWSLLMLERRVTPAKKVIIVANAEEVDGLVSKLNGHDSLIGVITDSLQPENPHKVLGTFDEVEELFYIHRPQVILITGNVPEDVKSRVAMSSLKYGCIIYVVPNLYEIMIAQSKLDQFKDTPVFQIRLTRNPGKEYVKRGIDCIVAVIGLLVTIPITLLTAIAIKVTSPGPVFYAQERVGRKNKCFMLYKFRTMVNNAEDKTGPVLSSKGDNRVTKVGKFLRLSRIDELPQLINVLKGDMSIVGPRPERPCFVEKFDKEVPGYAYRHVMHAGLTGLAQIAGKYSTSPQDKLRYDLLYAKGSSPLFDLQIMLQTVKVMIHKDKAS